MNFVHKWSAAGGPAAEPGVSGAETAGELLLTGLVLASLGWTTLCLGGFRPETMPVTTGLDAAAVIAWLGLAAARPGGVRLHWAALATLPFLAYAAANVLWVTPVPWLGWRDWLGWAQMAALFVVVLHGIRGPRARLVLVGGLVALGVVAVAMAAYQHFADPRWLMMGRVQAPQFRDRSSGPFGIPNSLAAFLNLLLPPLLALMLQRGAGAAQRILAGYCAALLAAGLLLTVSRGAWLALGLALAAWPLLAGSTARRRWLGCLGVCALLLATATVAYRREPEVRQRLDDLVRNRGEVSRVVLWRIGWALFREHPLAGTGAGSYDVLLERHRPARFWDDPGWAHNDYLNTLSDYGLAGFLLSFGVLAGLGAREWRRRRRGGGAAPGAAGAEWRWAALRVGIVIGLVAFALQLLVDFNLKIPALAQTAAVLLALALAPAAGRADAGGPGLRLPRIFAVATALAVAIAVPATVWPIYQAEALRYAARETLDRLVERPMTPEAAARRIGEAHDRLVLAVEIDPRNAQAWADLADAGLAQARLTPADAPRLAGDAERAASRALGISHAVAEFWVRRAQAYDLEGRWRDAWADFVEALALAPHRADIWYYYAYHLSLRDLESAKAALATCLSLDPWNGPALAFQKHLGGKNH